MYKLNETGTLNIIIASLFQNLLFLFISKRFFVKVPWFMRGFKCMAIITHSQCVWLNPHNRGSHNTLKILS